MELGKLPTLTRGDGDGMFTALHREIDRVFSDFTRGFPKLPEPWGGALRPSMDVKDAGASLEITLELPGLREKDVDVSVTDRVLTVSGEKKSEAERKEADYHVMERSYGKFARSLTLPFAPDARKIEAKFANGVLTISVAKPPEEKSAAKKIAVKGGA
jgi:HSP20 family protein